LPRGVMCVPVYVSVLGVVHSTVYMVNRGFISKAQRDQLPLETISSPSSALPFSALAVVRDGESVLLLCLCIGHPPSPPRHAMPPSFHLLPLQRASLCTPSPTLASIHSLHLLFVFAPFFSASSAFSFFICCLFSVCVFGLHHMLSYPIFPAPSVHQCMHLTTAIIVRVVFLRRPVRLVHRYRSPAHVCPPAIATSHYHSHYHHHQWHQHRRRR
jgi:hypothetical protein